MEKYKEGMLHEDALKGKHIIVTGGGTGLGKSMTEYFLRLGAKVTITSRKFDVLQNTQKELQDNTGGVVLPLACDVRKALEVEEMVNKAEEEMGQIDAVLNNAAGNFISPTEKLSTKAFDVIVDIVLKGTYNMTLITGKKWIKNKQPGNFLNIVTTYAWTGSGYVVPSACSKAGVLALTRSLAVEWAKYNIRSNAIAPGPFPTEGAWSRLFPKAISSLFDVSKKIPLRRVGEHQELANLAAYLVSDYSAYINGEVITIDGGEWLKGAGEFNMLEKVPGPAWKLLEKATRKPNKK